MDRKLRTAERKRKSGEGSAAQEAAERRRTGEQPTITIDGETYTVVKVYPIGWVDQLVQVDTEEGPEFVLAPSREVAGQAARARWADMAKNDKKEFTCLVGEETLIAWCLGEPAGPGTTKVDSLEKWLDLHLETPEEEWASYDGEEQEVEAVTLLDLELGWTPRVAYRHN